MDAAVLTFVDRGSGSPSGIVVLQAPLCPFFKVDRVIRCFTSFGGGRAVHLPAADGLLHVLQPSGLGPLSFFFALLVPVIAAGAEHGERGQRRGRQ
jgi:hypothetical protein